MAEIGEDEREVIRTTVWSGFFEPDQAGDLVQDFLLDDPDLDEAALRAAIAAEFSRKADAEKHWPATTDCDRLDAAFAALSATQVLALHHAGVTMSDGHVDAAEALARQPGHGYMGYCFYHAQDIETAIAGDGLWIAFEHVDGEVPEKVQVAQIIIAALQQAGLAPLWDGDPTMRIALEDFDWKRRSAG